MNRGYETYRELQNKYEDIGLHDLKLRNVKDMKTIYNIDVTNIKGYECLNESIKSFFESMIIKFYNGRGLVERSNTIPVKVVIKDEHLAYYYKYYTGDTYKNSFNYFYKDGSWG